ncbi:uncharacterized protein, partial [Cherax quadricarinatus]|uniref:uncharacterized protein n=1 Tax=Cherax quadricarinatus TaxID=27406 RepID=UPI00387E54E3
LKRELDAKEVLKVLLDSGSPSNITPSSRCSDSGLAAVNNSPYHGSTVEPGSQALVPIPVFTCQQYRVEALGEPRPQLRPLPRPLPRLKRITSSASARNAPASPRPRSQALPLDGVGPASSVSTVVFGRRHSWCCSRDVDDTKQYRSQSTQTFRDQEVPPLPDACLSNPETEILKVRGELAIPDFYCSHSSAQIRKEHEVSIPDGYCSHHETQVLKDNGTLAIPVSCCGRHDTGTLKDHSGLTIHDSCYSQSSTQILKENGGMSVLDTCCNHPSHHACSQHHPQHNDIPQQYEEHDQTHCHLDEDDSVFIIAND